MAGNTKPFPKITEGEGLSFLSSVMLSAASSSPSSWG
jgi:hypothetical protein